MLQDMHAKVGQSIYTELTKLEVSNAPPNTNSISIAAATANTYVHTNTYTQCTCAYALDLRVRIIRLSVHMRTSTHAYSMLLFACTHLHVCSCVCDDMCRANGTTAAASSDGTHTDSTDVTSDVYPTEQDVIDICTNVVSTHK